MKTPLFGKTFQEISEIVKSLSLPAFTAKQIADWIYRKNISGINEMTNLSAKARSMLDDHYTIGISAPVTEQVSKDGTRKYLFAVEDGRYVETAYIPEKERATLCISSQVGCRMACAFCMTARQGLKANLTANSILNQFRSIPDHDKLTNIVFMGMGEPFDNMTELMKSIEVLTSEYGYGWAPKRITVSTIGILPAVKQFMDNSRCHLAISLHHPVGEERRRIMPVEKQYPVKEVIDLLKTYDLNRQRRISFEYIMLAGINDSRLHVNELARLLNGLRCRINLIRFHPIPGSPYHSPDESTIEQFANDLNKKGITTTIRQSRGMDIDAACGMLSTARKGT